MKKSSIFCLSFLTVCLTSALAFGAEKEVAAAAFETVGSLTKAASFAIAISVLGAAVGQGLGVYAAAAGIARNPEATRDIRLTMIIGLAFIESLCIYGLIVVMLIFFVYPYQEIILKVFN
ncbi:MAG: ATP synthase F0 subunit C [Deltaproteobacteria bacterium]|jgi:F-type H+-transporting ATPase subunit c|nr:ATP synthase F0 subunit C [Deltaproteobacteria bacterium]